MAKDYYSTLGVSKSASAEEIKSAFRKLAHQYHPDKPGGDEAKFKEANEAYQVLGDAEKRQKYDQFGSAAFENGGGQGQGFGGFEDLGEMFGFGGTRRDSRRVRRGEDIQVDIDLTFKEAVFGVAKELNVTKHSRCERCAGIGAEPGSEMRSCEDCGGQGVKTVTQRTILGNMQSRVMCGSCDGAGEIPKKTCSTCRGDGVTRGRKSLTVNIPAGVDDGVLVRVRGEGEAIKSGEAGDLLLRIHVAADQRFEREGATIFSRLEIGFTQAALGDTIDVPTVDGVVALKILAGTQSGAEFRLREKGVPHRGGRGDQIVTVQVVTPKKLSREERRLLEDLDHKM